MQFLIKDFYDSEGRHSIEYKDHILCIKDNLLIIKVGNKYTGKFVELFKKSLVGWHNVRLNQNKYDIDSGKFINIETDILIKHNGKYQLKHYSISFIPLQTYYLDKFFNYMNQLNENYSKEELLKMSDQLRQNAIANLIYKLEEIKKFKIERQALINNFNNMIFKLKNNRNIEKIFLNYLSKYVGKNFLKPEYYIAFANDMLRDNQLYEQLKENFPMLNILNLDFYNSSNYKLEEIDKLVEFMNRTVCKNKDCAKLLTWIEICDVAITYYSNCFYELYGKQIGDLDNLCLKDCILKYIHSDILHDDENIRGMFVYFLMSLEKFDESDLNKDYLHCMEVFMDIYEKLKNESEYDRFIKSLLVKEQPNENKYTIDDIDLMTGSEFEQFVSQLFKKMGFKTTITKASKDQGIDIIAEKNGIRYGIQAKCYSNYVSNSAVQEVVAGSKFYKCDKALVITNSYFSNSAIELANANDVILWDREMLKRKIADLY